MKKTTFNLFFLFILGFGFFAFAPIRSYAAKVYLPTKVKEYTYEENNTDNRWKHFSTRT